MHPTAQQFLQPAASPPQLQAKIEAIEQPTLQAATEALASLAREYGFDLQAADFLTPTKEISEAELSAISAGATGDTIIWGGGRGYQWLGTEQENGYLKWQKIPTNK